MRKLLAVMAFLAIASPAIAQTAPSDTLIAVTTHGLIITIQGMDIDVEYTPDGKFTALDGQITGTWRIDGDKLCTTSSADPNESCVAYPLGKKSGDSFEVTGPNGSAMVKIK